VGIWSLILVKFFIVIASISILEELATSFSNVQAWIANNTGWFFVLASNLILAFMIYIALSRFSHVRLGGEKAEPEFSRPGWFAMLFSAGMGIGLLFYSVAEPMYHLMSPPHGADIFSAAAAEDAMATTFLHWGLHAWAIYALVGLALAYFAYNQKQPLRGIGNITHLYSSERQYQSSNPASQNPIRFDKSDLQ